MTLLPRAFVKKNIRARALAFKAVYRSIFQSGLPLMAFKAVYRSEKTKRKRDRITRERSSEQRKREREREKDKSDPQNLLESIRNITKSIRTTTKIYSIHKTQG